MSIIGIENFVFPTDVAADNLADTIGTDKGVRNHTTASTTDPCWVSAANTMMSRSARKLVVRYEAP
jgi:hypothetical protein